MENNLFSIKNHFLLLFIIFFWLIVFLSKFTPNFPMSKIFISFDHDKSYGRNLAAETQKQLESAGFEVFLDSGRLEIGSRELKRERIESSDVVVLAAPKKAQRSQQLLIVVGIAEAASIPVIPVFSERGSLWLLFKGQRKFDFSNQVDWPQLISSITEIQEEAIKAEIKAKEEALRAEIKAKEEAEKSRVKAIKDKNEADKLRQLLSNPHWASDVGEDQYGRYADLQINSVTQRFRLIDPGTFWMGSPRSEVGHDVDETRHQVTLTKHFWLADTSVTQALWFEVLGSCPARFCDNSNRPVEQISWNDSQLFLRSLNKLVRGLSACLPTEAQWEYACRAGTTSEYCFGRGVEGEQAHYKLGDNLPINPSNPVGFGTAPVKSFPANQWGLYEMHGNVFDWCQDFFHERLGGPAVDPKQLTFNKFRVVRGGGWASYPQFARSAYRGAYVPDYLGDGIGMRICIDVSGHVTNDLDTVPRRTSPIPTVLLGDGDFSVSGE